MRPVAIVMPYFGSFKPSFTLWLESCRRNPELDWLVFTDNPAPEDLPQNVIWTVMALSDVAALAAEKLGRTVCLERAYKLCDMKPIYGVIFQDWLRDYEYWGHGDMDVIYGRVWPYLQQMDYRQYDKINRMGHFTLIRNTDACNWAFDQPAEGTERVDVVLMDGSRNYGFDERDINQKFKVMGLRLYDRVFAADMDVFYKRMRCVDMTTFRHLCGIPDVEAAPGNAWYQLFVLQEGRAVRYYLHGGEVLHDEFAYLHFRQEAPILMENLKADTFLVSRDGFFEFDTAALKDPAAFRALVKQYNLPDPRWKEFLRLLRGWLVVHNLKPAFLP